MKEEIKKHFESVDPVIGEVFRDFEFDVLVVKKDSSKYFSMLCRDIIAQQLATKAAQAILVRFHELFHNKHITPDALLSVDEQRLRDVGMSWGKVRYVRDLATKTANKEIAYDKLTKMNKKEVIQELTKVKGIGPWTAEMFLIFTLGHEDIYSHGDLGLKNAMKKLYALKDTKNITKKIQTITQKWSPYRSYGCLALWHSVDNK